MLTIASELVFMLQLKVGYMIGGSEMSYNKVTAVIFEGGNPVSQIEHDMVYLRRGMVKDNINRFLQVSEIDELVDRTFNGSLPNFIAAFTKNKKLSSAEIKAIRQMIDTYEDK